MERVVEYLDPQEQLRIGALVNRLCEVSPGDFYESTQVPEASEIVKALDPKLEALKSSFTAPAFLHST